MKAKLALSIVFTMVFLGATLVHVNWPDAATDAETDRNIVELVTHAKSAADQRKLVKWYEQHEDEVRKQADLYRKLAFDYRDYRVTEATVACEDIARHYDGIAKQFERLAEEHRHLAAAAP